MRASLSNFRSMRAEQTMRHNAMKSIRVAGCQTVAKWSTRRPAIERQQAEHQRRRQQRRLKHASCARQFQTQIHDDRTKEAVLASTRKSIRKSKPTANMRSETACVPGAHDGAASRAVVVRKLERERRQILERQRRRHSHLHTVVAIWLRSCSRRVFVSRCAFKTKRMMRCDVPFASIAMHRDEHRALCEQLHRRHRHLPYFAFARISIKTD
jgi:hypothetical protein